MFTSSTLNFSHDLAKFPSNTGESPTLHVALQDRQHGHGLRPAVWLVHLIQTRHFVCFLSASEVETWTEMDWLHPNLNKTNTTWQQQISRRTDLA